MICEYCKKNIPDDAELCPFCGERQTAVPMSFDYDTGLEKKNNDKLKKAAYISVMAVCAVALSSCLFALSVVLSQNSKKRDTDTASAGKLSAMTEVAVTTVTTTTTTTTTTSTTPPVMVKQINLSAPEPGDFQRADYVYNDGEKYYLTWEEVKNAEGYEVEIGENYDTFFSDYVYTQETDKTRYEISSSEPKKVSAKVRAYAYVDGEKIYSKWSKKRTVTFRGGQSLKYDDNGVALPTSYEDFEYCDFESPEDSVAVFTEKAKVYTEADTDSKVYTNVYNGYSCTVIGYTGDFAYVLLEGKDYAYAKKEVLQMQKTEEVTTEAVYSYDDYEDEDGFSFGGAWEEFKKDSQDTWSSFRRNYGDLFG